MLNEIRTLPVFKINASNMQPINEETESNQNHKKKLKHPEVQVHKPHAEPKHKDDIKIHKTFSANVNFQKTKKDDTVKNDTSTQYPSLKKPKRKYLMKQNDRLTAEVTKLTEQLQVVQQSLDKKDMRISSLKQKLSEAQNVNDRIVDENNRTKLQYAELLTEQQKITDCTQCEELKEIIRRTTSELDETRKINKETNEDINMLKNVVYRLNVQLERYQEKLRQSNISCNISPVDMNENADGNRQFEGNPGHSDHNHTPISWGNVNTHTLGPLLDAYQNTVKEKEDIIQKYEVELSNFTGKLKGIIEENEELHRKNIDDTTALKKFKDEYETIKTELEQTKEQNLLLIKKCGLKHEKLQELYKVYDHKIATMRRDYEILQEQYHRTRAELSSVVAKQQSLLDSHEMLKADKQTYIPLAVHNSSVGECKRLFEELKVQYDSEKTKLTTEIKQMEEKIPQLETQIVELSAEKREFQIKAKTAEKQIKKLEQKLTEVSGTLSQVQVSRDSCKRQLAKAIQFGKDLVKEQELLLKQLSMRSKESKAAIHYGNTVISQMDSLKSQLKNVQRDAFEELATVEQRISEQDMSIESMRKEHEEEINQLIQEIRSKDNVIAKLLDENAPAQPYMLFKNKTFHNTC